MTREDWDLIWGLVKASEAVGYHGAKLDTEETTEAFTEAYSERHKCINELVKRLSDD